MLPLSVAVVDADQWRSWDAVVALGTLGHTVDWHPQAEAEAGAVNVVTADSLLGLIVLDVSVVLAAVATVFDTTVFVERELV